MGTSKRKTKKKPVTPRRRGKSRRLAPEMLPVAVALSVADLGRLYGVSAAVVRCWIHEGLPALRFPGKLSVLRVEGSAWVLARFRSDTAGAVDISRGAP